MRAVRLAAVTFSSVLCAAPAALPALAQERWSGIDRPRFEVDVGAFFSSSDSNVRFDSRLGPGTSINLEDLLGLDGDETVPRIDGMFRFGPQRRQRIEASLFGLSRDGERAVGREVRIGDRVFDASTTLHAEHDLTLLTIDYTYMFIERENVEVGASIGVFGLHQEASIADASRSFVEEDDIDCPLPTLGLRAQVGLGPRLVARGAADAFFIETGDYAGQLYDARASLDLGVTGQLGIGLGYDFSRLDVTHTRRIGDVAADVTFQGPMLYARWSF